MSTALLYAGVDQMLEPAEMSQLLGRRVETVETNAVDGLPGTTGAEVLAISLDGEPEPTLMLKHVHAATDWVALFTRDEQRRALRLWSKGVFDRMPAAVEPAVIACGEWADGYGILMPNLGSEMLELAAIRAWASRLRPTLDLL